MEILKAGIPSVNDLKNIPQTPLYSSIEEYSSWFLEKYRHHLRNRQNPMGLNQFHGWSRIWEYPFVASRLLNHFKGKSAKVFDAGSGLGFFPFYLTKNSPGLSILCGDQIAALAEPFKDISSKEKLSVEFVVADIRKLSLQDKSMDGVYCVSVLEHTDCYEDIIKEFHRILKPGGRLWVTIDISQDGCSDIPKDEARKFTLALNKHFKMIDFSAHDFETDLRRTDVATSKNGRQDYLPWMFPRLSALKASLSKGRISLSLDITFCCFELEAR